MSFITDKEKVFVNAMYDWDTDELIGSMMDEFTLVTCVGNHIISQELWMTGDDCRVSHMCRVEHVCGMSDLDIMAQELFAKLLGIDCMYELEYIPAF